MAIDGGLRALFHKQFKRLGAHCQSIETGGTGRGIPDTNMCLRGVDVWVEFKKTSANSISSLEPEQCAWIEQRSRCNGRVFLAVRKKRNNSARLKALDELWLIAGASATFLREGGLNDRRIKVLGIFTGGPAKWNWGRIQQILFED